MAPTTRKKALVEAPSAQKKQEVVATRKRTRDEPLPSAPAPPPPPPPHTAVHHVDVEEEEEEEEEDEAEEESEVEDTTPTVIERQHMELMKMMAGQMAMAQEQNALARAQQDAFTAQLLHVIKNPPKPQSMTEVMEAIQAVRTGTLWKTWGEGLKGPAVTDESERWAFPLQMKEDDAEGSIRRMGGNFGMTFRVFGAAEELSRALAVFRCVVLLLEGVGSPPKLLWEPVYWAWISVIKLIIVSVAGGSEKVAVAWECAALAQLKDGKMPLPSLLVSLLSKNGEVLSKPQAVAPVAVPAQPPVMPTPVFQVPSQVFQAPWQQQQSRPQRQPRRQRRVPQQPRQQQRNFRGGGGGRFWTNQ